MLADRAKERYKNGRGFVNRQTISDGGGIGRFWEVCGVGWPCLRKAYLVGGLSS